MATKLFNEDNVSRLAETYQARRKVCIDGADIDISVDLECFSRARIEPDDAAAQCMIEKPIQLATAVASELNRERGTKGEQAVYIIHQQGSGHSKIGIGADPARRLVTFQIAHWQPIGISALFWIMEGSAEGIEMLSHRLASHMGLKARGEWVSADPAVAARLVAATCLSANVKFADSAMWIRNRQRIRTVRSRMYTEWCEDQFAKPRLPHSSFGA